MKIQTSLTKLFAIAALAVILSTVNAVAATFTVTNAKDSGVGSLRDVIAQANADGEDDTINFDPAFFNVARTITLASEIQITADGANPGKAVTFNGPGASLLTISGNNVCRPFFVDVNSTVAMSGLTVRDGNGVGTVINLEGRSGGAILVHAGTALTLTNVTIRNNTVANSGGGIFLNGARNFTVSGSLFTENNANFGGGIVDSGSNVKTLVNTTVSNNTAIGQVGGASFDGLKTTISNCLITGNSAGADPNVVPAGGAGSIGGLGLFATTATVTDTTISNNVAGSSPSSTFEGREGFIGGVSVNSDSAIFRRVTVSGNTDHSGATAGGAGMQLRSTGSVEVIDSVVSNNRHSIYFTPSPTTGPRPSTVGGGIVTVNGAISIINTTIAGNVAENGLGGGIWVFSDGLKVINSTITGNVSELNNPSSNQDGGGGIFIDDRVTTLLPTIQNSIIAGNTGPTGPDVTGAFISAGYNLIGDSANSTGFGAKGDQLNVDPLLDPVGLADHGGLTPTIALQSNSPAIDKGKSADVMTDQRGLPRPFNNPSIPNAAGGDGSDIGAFEVQPANTMPGNNVTAEAPAGDATVTFHSITKAGFTTFGAIVPPSSAGAPPEGYTILESAPAYDIRTTATFTAPLTVCFTVNSITDADEFERVRILHGENGELVDRTDLSSIDFASHTVCASVDSLSPFVVALAPSLPNRFQNISTRLRVETGEDVLIGGFIVLGTKTKTVILRAIGPSLADFGVTGVLADPVLELHGGDGSLITSNDNWKTTQKAAIIATGVAPTNDKESAIIAELAPGASYTLVVKGKSGGTGVGLVEAYDLAGAADSEFANISTRGKVGTGADVMIGGFILAGGTGDNTVLVRALGPSLGDAGVSGALADPTLELRDPDGNIVRSNDNWKDEQMAAIVATGIPPTKNLESALVQTLGPGNYTAIVAGKDGGIGVGLVEAFRLQ